MRKKAKKRPGRPSAAEGRVKFTTTLPPQTIIDLGILAADEGHASSAQVIVKLVRIAMELRPVNQSERTK